VKRQIPLQKLTLLLIVCGLQFTALSQYWQQKLDYTIDVTLNDKEKTLDAFERIVYTNNSPDTLHFIWFHLWPNAYKNDQTAFSDQSLELGNTDFYFSDKEKKGYINRLDFKVDGSTAKTEDHPQHIDIIKLILPKPLLPNQQVTITTPFHEKLPFNFSRGGYDGESFQITQWYPKPAVYDKNGWHPMPYLDQGEFYSEFGTFDVRITVPKNYVIAATGVLQNEDEKEWLSQRSSFEWEPAKEKIKSKGTVKTITRKFPRSSEQTKTLQYKQSDVHDFAWFADKRFIVKTDTCQLPSGRIVNVSSYYTPGEKTVWISSIQYSKDALRFYSNEIGEYPYDVATVVHGPQSFGGGLEYPTITVISPVTSAKELDGTIAHELGHNWFYGILGSNERDHPWMDEGMNTFYDYKYMQSKYGKQTLLTDLLYRTVAKRKTDQPIETASENFSGSNYFLSAYHKAAEWMQLLEDELGRDSLRMQMHEYFNQWKFKHPQPEDFKAVFKTELGNKGDETFSLLNTKGLLPNNTSSGFKIVSPPIKGSIKGYLKNPAKDILLISPAAGINAYDKLMIGGLISNYKLPPNNFQFLAVPMYGTGSKKFTGLGKLNYTIMSDGTIRKTDIFLNAARFSMFDPHDSLGNYKFTTMFNKLAPGIKFTFKESPKSTLRKYIQWKTFFINEQQAKYTTDTIRTATDTSYKQVVSLGENNNYTVNQLQFVYQNTRALYPFKYQLNVEQISDMIKPTLTINYFFNYPKSEGLSVRLFAGKIFYIGGRNESKSFSYDRYALKMSGRSGYEDYTYSNFFLGRNKFEGTASQQIAMSDGGFKFRTNLFPIGNSDNWLIALNLSSSVSDKINPLSVLPIKIPLKVYADIGTYAEAWDRNATVDRFLFDAGLQVSVLKDFLNIYIPVIHSSPFKQYYKSYLSDHRFSKSISFTLNFYNKSISDLNNLLEF
jgi:hypothetical protein